MHNKFDKSILILFTLFTVLALLPLQNIKSDYEYQIEIPGSKTEQGIEKVYRTFFPPEQVLAIAVETKTTNGEQVLLVLESLKDVPGISILAPELMEFPVVGQQLLTGNTPPIDVDMLLDSDPFLASLFMSGDGKARCIYVYGTGKEKPADLMDRIKLALPENVASELHFWGAPYYYAIQRDRTRRDAFMLIPLAAFIALLVHFLLVRNIGIALCLWTVSLVPSIWVLALYPLTGTIFRNDSILVPIEILALSTSYAIQYFRYATLKRNEGRGQDIRGVVPIILLSGGTTILGFASLLAISITSIRYLAIFIMLGIGFALLSALFLLPALLRCLRSFYDYTTPPAARAPVLFRKPLVSVTLILLIGIGLIGLFLFRGNGSRDIPFRSDDEFTNTTDYFSERFGGMEELELFIEGGDPFFFIEPGNMERMRKLATVYRDDSRISMVLDAASFIDWTFQRLNRTMGKPLTMEDIGETVELAASKTDTLSMASLLAGDSSVSRIMLRFRLGSKETLEDFVEMTLEKARNAFPGAKVNLFGGILERRKLNRYLVRGMLAGVFSFIPTLFIFFLLYFRSFKMATLVVIPPMSALLMYFGLAGLLGFQIDPVVTVGAAAVMGVGVDDVIHLLLTARNGRHAGLDEERSYFEAISSSGVSILQTTIIITVCLLILLFSVFVPVLHTGILSIAALWMATVVTLGLVPFIAVRMK